jgi:carbon-monoxide dehydrogenase medium subunit
MPIAAFELHRPDTLDEVLDVRQSLGPESAPYAGGTELLLAMKMGVLHYPHLVDLKRVDELGGIEVTGSQIVLGATTTHRDVEEDPTIARLVPAFARMVRDIANVRVRAVGTLAGNLAFAEPAADPPALLVALGASVELRQAGRTRTLTVEEFLVGAYETALEDTEIVTAVRIPVPAPASRATYVNYRVIERPVVGAAVAGEVVDGRFAGPPSVVLGAADEVPRRVPADLLDGCAVDDAGALQEVARSAAEAIDPVDDLSGSAEYKRHVATVMTRRALEALAAQGNGA